jgi:hypothetical protein
MEGLLVNPNPVYLHGRFLEPTVNVSTEAAAHGDVENQEEVAVERKTCIIGESVVEVIVDEEAYVFG